MLTLLIHLGYLAYNEDERTVFIPNAEIRQEFRAVVKMAVVHLIAEQIN